MICLDFFVVIHSCSKATFAISQSETLCKMQLIAVGILSHVKNSSCPFRKLLDKTRIPFKVDDTILSPVIGFLKSGTPGLLHFEEHLLFNRHASKVLMWHIQ